MKLTDFPHLVEMQEKLKIIPYGSKEYWMMRCINLEKSIDPTYSKFERDNCREFYKLLANKSR